ncbi:glutathione S-transferase [Polyplosphaeria fusca]|uniref:Glutathione S-transferase n=1 Tax=Polyplosphaeria fusca TaxID=682080 RepID=A0A9P4QJE0_9PLEO|nr:glutathione S-transferase [Polyplosphaeria fusca]
MPSLTVHHLQVGQGERIPWLLEELGIAYEVKPYQRAPIFSPKELKDLHPLGASPVLEDATEDAKNPLFLAESSAVADYLIHKYGNGRLALAPSDANYADYLYWFHYTNGTLQPAIGRRMTVYALTQDQTNPRVRMVDERLQLAFQNLNDRVEKKTWLAGDEFTAADIMAVFSFTTMRSFMPYDLSPYPGILAWLKRCTEREGYRTAMKKADPELDIEGLISAKGPGLFDALKKMMAAQQAK